MYSKNQKGSIIKNEQMESQSKIAILHFMNDRKNQTKNYQKKTLFWDRQHLYSQNLMLRQKIKELVDSNTKAKTKLLKSQKQMLTLTTKGRSLSSSSMIFKPDSHRFTSMQKIPSITWKFSKSKEQDNNKIFLQMKQMIRQLKQDVEKLQNQNSFIKKSIKYTRIAELQTQIREMQEENIRLHRMAIQAKQKQDESYALYCKQIDQMKLSIRREGQQKIFYAKQLTKAKNQLKQVVNKYKQLEKNKMSNEKRLTNEMQKLKKNMWSKNKSQLQAKLEYSATAFDKSNSPSLNFDKLIQIQSNQKLYNYLSEGVNFKSHSTQQSPSKKLAEKQSLTSLQLLTAKNGKQELARISNSQPFEEQINEENYEDQFERQQQGNFPKSKEEEQDISEKAKNKSSKQEKISIEEEIKQKMNDGNESEEYQYILEEDL